MVTRSDSRDTAGGRGATGRGLAWSWTRGTFGAADLGDPTTATGYALCIYDDGALVSTREIPPGGTCRGKSCWKAGGGGSFSYHDKDGASGGIVRVSLKPGDGNASVTVTGRGANLSPPLPLTGAQGVVVQLVRTDGPGCWTAAFAAPARRSTATSFTDRRP